ncbi:SUMF1/EgtB/PvdO family nonheme iron enzyme [Neptuniibacter sp. CAU 1671]|uniref:SUMF1/EgtB/PvdO family nonheme iron enzyme n=1 Tax=Neptuniibacter sp. CAU 1671 TaxID=3032593 RepID=UPI0023DA04F7|nr:SUMF1/EgtB/PvdO family nonheme iron enzyme [Neptuniibacter sp. CAU 1671]MDF2181584.1 SUMF1/EgtB/PvdO family nonheme iron enzyme [Neptuniibacter sp. CAU 1671]
MKDGLDSSALTLQPGQLLGPEHRRFRLLNALGNLPFATLWLAEDCHVKDTPKATLLLPNPALLDKPSLLESLKRHAALSKQLKNKFLLEGYGAFQTSGGPAFLAYETCSGLTLQQLLDKKQLPDTAQRIVLLKQLAHALDSGFQLLHQPHGLLCPELVFVQPGHGIKLFGFALSETLSQLPAELNLQHCDLYQPPESVRYQPLTRQADVFSYACIVYHLLTGQPPFAAEVELQQRTGTQLPGHKTLTDEQFTQLQKALDSDPSQRHSHCSALAKTLFKEAQAEPGTPPEIKAQAPAAELTKTTATHSPSTARPKLPWKQTLGGISLFLLGVWVGWISSSGFDNASITELIDEKEALAAQLLMLQQQKDDIQAKHQTLSSKLNETSLQLDNATAQLAALSAQRAAQADDPAIQIFRDQIGGKRYGPEMVILPAGEFLMGDQSGQGDDNESPVNTVRISKPFALSRFEVTYTEYDLFAEETGRSKPDDNGWGRDNMPVTNVSWQDAVAYTRWLSERTGQPYRLPSEAEWEYAARAGTNTTYWWGNELRDNMAVCDQCGSQWDGKQAAPVGSFTANPWGLHDMTGNVDEWVADCYRDHYPESSSDSKAFLRSGCQQRVMRGGSWFEIARLIRPSSRYRHPANSKRNSWGFRIAVDLTQSAKDSVNE